MLCGVVRVGLVAKGLLIKEDMDLELVLMCREKPTETLLHTVCERLPLHIKVRAAGSPALCPPTVPGSAHVGTSPPCLGYVCRIYSGHWPERGLMPHPPHNHMEPKDLKIRLTNKALISGGSRMGMCAASNGYFSCARHICGLAGVGAYS